MNREDLIQDYLHGRLGKRGQAEFDALYESDADFRDEVEFQKNLDAAFSSINKEETKEKLRGFENEMERERKNPSGVRYLNEGNKTNSTYKKWLTAACILVVVGIGLMFFFNKSTPEQLYYAHFEAYPNVVNPIIRGESETTLANKTFIAYEKGEYEKAITGLSQLYEQTGKGHFLLYQASALLEIGKTEKAIPLLKKQLALDDAFSEKSRWYLALAYLKTGETEKAKRLFKEISSENSYKTEEAKSILSELE